MTCDKDLFILLDHIRIFIDFITWILKLCYPQILLSSVLEDK